MGQIGLLHTIEYCIGMLPSFAYKSGHLLLAIKPTLCLL